MFNANRCRRGTPLPPFPKPTHGTRATGLKRFVSVADALQPLERLGDRALNDEYHRPQDLKPKNKTPYNPYTSFLKGCVTTSGGENYHYSGTRRYTAREMSLLQTFHLKYRFSGSRTQAIKQIGNAFPPVMAEALYREIARTLEAFDHGLIGAEDIIDDLDAFLEKKGVVLPESLSASQSAYSAASSSPKSPYRYLVRNDSSSVLGTTNKTSSIFGRKNNIEPAASSSNKATRSVSLPFRAFRSRQQVLVEAELAKENGELIELEE